MIGSLSTLLPWSVSLRRQEIDAPQTVLHENLSSKAFVESNNNASRYLYFTSTLPAQNWDLLQVYAVSPCVDQL